MCFDKENENFEFCEEYFQHLIDNKIPFDDEDLKMFDECCRIEIKQNDWHRWTMSMTSICQLGEKYYAIDWEAGLTEHQEDEWYEQPYEVKPIKKIITVKEWVAVND